MLELQTEVASIEMILQEHKSTLDSIEGAEDSQQLAALHRIPSEISKIFYISVSTTLTNKFSKDKQHVSPHMIGFLD